MSSVQPISSTAMSSLLWEIDNNGAEALYGSAPWLLGGTPVPTQVLGRLGSVLALLLEKVVPRVWDSLNENQVTVVRRTKVAIPDDSLGVRWVETTQDLYVVISGPTSKSLERGLLEISDYEVLIPANTLGTSLGENDAIIIGGVYHDVVGVQAHPKMPPAVAYRYWCKRAA